MKSSIESRQGVQKFSVSFSIKFLKNSSKLMSTTVQVCRAERSEMSEPHFHYFTRITNKFVIYQEGTKLTFMAFSFHEFPELSFIVRCRITKSTYFSFCSSNDLFFTKFQKTFLESISEDPSNV